MSADKHIPDATLWAVHIQGPDDIVAVADYLTAVKVANTFNEWWEALKTERPLHPYDPRMWASPVEYTGGAKSHAEWVAKPSVDYAGFIATAIRNGG